MKLTKAEQDFKASLHKHPPELKAEALVLVERIIELKKGWGDYLHEPLDNQRLEYFRASVSREVIIFKAYHPLVNMPEICFRVYVNKELAIIIEGSAFLSELINEA